MNDNNRDKAWLSKQIESAQKDKGSWPDWMQKAARFEGGSHEDSRGSKPYVCKDAKHK